MNKTKSLCTFGSIALLTFGLSNLSHAEVYFDIDPSAEGQSTDSQASESQMRDTKPQASQKLNVEGNTVDSNAETFEMQDDVIDNDLDALEAEEGEQHDELAPKVILEGVPVGEKLQDERGYIENSTERYLEPTKPPGEQERSAEIFLENNSMKQGFLTGFVTKRADVDVKLKEHPPSEVPQTSRFQIANFGDFIRIGHADTQALIGYHKNYFGFRSVYLQKDYNTKENFWTRWKIAPSGKSDWYLIRNYHNPKYCLAIGWSKKLRMSRCNINNKWQQWRFLKEKKEAYWIPDNMNSDLDII